MIHTLSRLRGDTSQDIVVFDLLRTVTKLSPLSKHAHIYPICLNTEVEVGQITTFIQHYQSLKK